MTWKWTLHSVSWNYCINFPQCKKISPVFFFIPESVTYAYGQSICIYWYKFQCLVDISFLFNGFSTDEFELPTCWLYRELTSWTSASDTGAELSTICGAAMLLGNWGRLALILEEPLKTMFTLLLKKKQKKLLTQALIIIVIWWCLKSGNTYIVDTCIV